MTALKLIPVVVPARTHAWIPWKMPEPIGPWSLELPEGFYLLSFAIDGARIIDAYRLGGLPCTIFNGEIPFARGLAAGTELTFSIMNVTDEERTFVARILHE